MTKGVWCDTIGIDKDGRGEVMKRVFLMVLDSFGIGEAPDSAAFGDSGANTLASCVRTGDLKIPNLLAAGFGEIDGVSLAPSAPSTMPRAAVARLFESSRGKDTTIGHWEIAGLVSARPLPTYPDGFPDAVIDAFSAAVGRQVLCNRPYSGTRVIADYGEEHLKTGALIVYTSADSVFQIAAHESLVPPETLYEYCRIARSILTGEHAVGRVIARPFIGEAGHFTRTAHRRDFSLEAPAPTLLDDILAAGGEVRSIGKISDIFAARGVSTSYPTHSNEEGMAVTLAQAGEDFRGLCFANLVDFDMLYGHRRDAVGYARALTAFDAWLPAFLASLGEEDVLMLTADHGCDPAYLATTDHTREAVPWMIFGQGIRPVNLGTLCGFDHIAATIADLLRIPHSGVGESVLSRLL